MGENLIFSSNYYKSLLIILTNDKRNKKVILDFINSIPLNVYKKILKSLEEYEVNKRGVYIQKKVNDIIYYFRINSFNGEICFGKYSDEDIDNNDIFLMKLYPYSDTFDDNKNIPLGSLIYQMRDETITKVWDCDKIEYNLVNKKGVIFLLRLYNYAIFFRKVFNKIDIELFDDIIDIKSLGDLNQKLLKKRTK